MTSSCGLVAAALRPVELALKKCDRPPGENDRVRDAGEYRRHVAKNRIDREREEQEEERIVHPAATLGRRTARINREETQG